MTPVNVKNPGVTTKSFISWMFETAEFSGAFMAMTTDPIMQLKHPTLPTKLRRSFRKIADKMVVMTTERAPRGVTRMASTNA